MARKTPDLPSKDDGSTSSKPFAATAKELLEKALTLRAANRSLSCADIEKPLGEVCANAQARGMKAERLIIDLKEIWHSVPDSGSQQKSEVVSQLVSMCIREFYRIHPTEPDKT